MWSFTAFPLGLVIGLVIGWVGSRVQCWREVRRIIAESESAWRPDPPGPMPKPPSPPPAPPTHGFDPELSRLLAKEVAAGRMTLRESRDAFAIVRTRGQ